MRVHAFLIAALMAGAGADAIPPAKGTYAIEAGVEGVVDLYDLSSVTQTADGFSIVEVVASRHLPTIFGPVAYRVSRERYHCGSGSYEIGALAEYRRDGRLLNAMRGEPRGAMRVVAGTASSEMYNRFCPSGTAGELAGLAPVRTVQATSHYAAFRIGDGMLARRPR